MPELPDVEVFRRYLAATSLHERITGVEVCDSRVLDGISRRRLKHGLEGRTLESADRHGKCLFALLDETGVLALHFGMTGFLKYFKNPEAETDHPRVILRFRSGYRLVYDSQRLLGSVALIPDRAAFIRRKELGADALSVSFDEFASILDRRRGSVKSALMNQKLLAGIGNVYSDEILFQARMHPKAGLEGLRRDSLQRLHEAMGRVLKTAIDCRADPRKMPDGFLLPHRGGGDPCPRCGGPIESIRISGRSAYYCPSCQPAA
jgi:formamidopyrimidine-DNA glycosylase